MDRSGRRRSVTTCIYRANSPESDDNSSQDQTQIRRNRRYGRRLSSVGQYLTSSRYLGKSPSVDDLTRYESSSTIIGGVNPVGYDQPGILITDSTIYVQPDSIQKENMVPLNKNLSISGDSLSFYNSDYPPTNPLSSRIVQEYLARLSTSSASTDGVRTHSNRSSQLSSPGKEGRTDTPPASSSTLFTINYPSIMSTVIAPCHNLNNTATSTGNDFLLGGSHHTTTSRKRQPGVYTDTELSNVSQGSSGGRSSANGSGSESGNLSSTGYQSDCAAMLFTRAAELEAARKLVRVRRQLESDFHLPPTTTPPSLASTNTASKTSGRTRKYSKSKSSRSSKFNVATVYEGLTNQRSSAAAVTSSSGGDSRRASSTIALLPSKSASGSIESLNQLSIDSNLGGKLRSWLHNHHLLASAPSTPPSGRRAQPKSPNPSINNATDSQASSTHGSNSYIYLDSTQRRQQRRANAHASNIISPVTF